VKPVRLNSRYGFQGLCSVLNSRYTIHEIGARIGLFHEQCRNDRDTYVDVQWSNIKPEFQSNYNKYGAVGDDVGVDDYSSIMHYPKFAPDQAVNPNLAVLIPKGPPEPPIGQRTAFSPGDISTIATIYPPG
jgi:hypothetical protein